ncbi:hypothetical protein STSO111631_02555 [Stackebrandtia soli]
MTLRQGLVAITAGLITLGMVGCQASPVSEATKAPSEATESSLDERFTSDPFTGDKIDTVCAAVQTATADKLDMPDITVDRDNPFDVRGAECSIDQPVTESQSVEIVLQINPLNSDDLETAAHLFESSDEPVNECQIYDRIGFLYASGKISPGSTPTRPAMVGDTEYCRTDIPTEDTYGFGMRAAFTSHGSAVVIEFRATLDTVLDPEPPLGASEVEALSDAVMEAVLAGL